MLNVKLKVGCSNLMLAAQVECKVLKLIFGGAGIEHHIYPDQTPHVGTM